jgi:dCTP deaminase
MYLSQNELLDLLASGELIIRPLLDPEQVGTISIDLRLGTDFLLTFQGRHSAIDVSVEEFSSSVSKYFQESRRLVGSSFLFHPMQTVLCSTLEYIKLPEDVFMELSMRSSYSRLGISLSTIVQPGYCGCASLELTNVNNTPVKITVGSRIIQARFVRINQRVEYFNGHRKYVCQVRPEVSQAGRDKEKETLQKLYNKHS